MDKVEPKGMKGLSAGDADKLRKLRGWDDLTPEEHEEWYASHPEHRKLSPLKMSLVYRNNKYFSELGEDVYNNNDIPTLAKMYEDKVVGDAFKEYYGSDAAYGDDNNIGELQLLTTSAKKSLLESGHLNDADAEAQVRDFEEGLEKKRTGLSGLLRWANEQNMPGRFDSAEVADEKTTQSYAQVLQDKRQGEVDRAIAASNKEKIDASKEDIDLLYNYYTNGQTAWNAVNGKFTEAFARQGGPTNKDISGIIDDMVLGNLITKTQGAQLESLPTEQKVNYIGQILETSDFNPSRVSKMFDQVALPREIEYTSDFTDETQKYTLPGSRTYRALKDTDRFSNFGSGDKLKEYLTWQVLSQKYGTGDAISALETDMARYAKDNEGFKEWISDVHSNVVLGGIANIMNKVNAIGNMAVEARYGTDGLANVLAGKNPDGSEREQRRVFTKDNVLSDVGNSAVWFYDNALNPAYWSKVDQYNTFDPFMIAEADANGGISPFVTTRLPDEPLRFFSTDTLKEALKMTKFVWSDYLVGQGLGAATRGVSSLATRISPGFGRFMNTAGAYGTVAASGMGIAESYGVMTYDQTYQEMMEALNKRENTSAAEAAAAAREDPEYKKRIDEVVAERVAQQERITAGQERPIKLSEEEIRKQVEADFNNYYINNVWKNDEDVIRAHDDWEKLARRAATNAYMVDATIEEIRMAASNFTFRKYLFDNGTLSALGDNSKKYVDTYAKSATELAEANSKAVNRAKAVFKPFWGGFQSNYFDDVTVAFGKGFGLGQYNSWLQNKYDPAKAVSADELPSAFIEGLDEAWTGAKSALSDKQSFYDGFVGALGSFTSVMPRFTTAERNQAMENMNRKEGDQLTAGEKINRAVMNPLLDAYYTAKGNEERTSEILPIINKAITDKKEALENIIGAVIEVNSVSEANQSGSILDRKTAKENQAFQLLYSLEELNASPLVSEFPIVQNAREEIDRLASGQITEDDINQYRSQPGNRNATAEEAADRLQKNAKSLKEMSKRISDAKQTIDQSIVGRELNKDLKEQLIYQLSMDDAWSTRLSDMEKQISGSSKSSDAHSAVAAYGNKSELEKNQKAAENNLARLIINKEHIKRRIATVAEALEAARKRGDNAEAIAALEQTLMQEQLSLQSAFETIREAKAKAKELARDAREFSGEETPVLTSQEILRLNPEDRATILKAENKDNYSAEQQIEIEKALAELKAKNPDAEMLVSDAGTLYTRVRDNKKAYRRMLSNPEAATAYVESIRASRAIHALNVIAEKRVDEAFAQLDTAESDEELSRMALALLNSKEYGLNSMHIANYIANHPEKKGVMQGFLNVAKVREDAMSAIKDIAPDKATRDLFVTQATEATANATNEEEAMSALEELIDRQTNSTAKLQYDRILEKVKELGHQRDATKLRNREEERRLKAEAEEREQKEQESKSGKAHGWDGFDVGTPVYKDGAYIGVVSGYYALPDGKYTLRVTSKFADGTTGTREFGTTMISQLSTEKPASNEKATTATEEVKAKEEKPTRKGEKQITKALKQLEEAKTVEDKAQAIATYETNKYHGAEVTAEEDAKIQKAKEELAKEGYEVVDMLGKSYHEGMKATASFVEDDSLAPGAEIITSVVKPQINKDGKMIQAAQIVVSQNPVELTSVADVNLEVDAEGKLNSPSASQQAAAQGRAAVEVPTSDATEQGNVIESTDNGILSGNKWVTYNLEKLKDDGVVEELEADNPNSIFGKMVSWLKSHKTNLQEIIDEEFSRVLLDNPDTEIRFMIIKSKDDLSKVLFNVIEMTPEVAKYHDDNRGGVIQANGKSWLIVGTTGFTTAEQHSAYDRTRGQVNKRSLEHFRTNKDALYYVDPIAYTKVQSTTSGRIVNRRLGETAIKLKKVSELLKSFGSSLAKGEFGIQTKDSGVKGFAVTNNTKNKDRVFPPRDAEDNRGRAFVLLETPNGNKIPGMIEPAMLNEISENSPLRRMIDDTIANLFSVNYETRDKAIKELCGFLVLDDKKNILIGTKDSAVLTIKVEGKQDITQKLGKDFDSTKFFNDLKAANFQINVTLKTLEDSAFMLGVYDESNALMTTVDSMRTAGMSYNVYSVDASGKPIITTPARNAEPGTGKSEIKKSAGIRVNNVTYDLKNSKFVNRYTGEEVTDLSSPLYLSCYYNYYIRENGLTPISTNKTKEFFQVTGKKGDFVISRDNLGNVEFMTLSESRAFMEKIQREIERKQRQDNLEEVSLFDDVPATQQQQQPVVTKEETLTTEQINQQALGNFEEPAVKVEPQPQKEIIEEAKAEQPTESKEVISDIGNKSLDDLQNQENLSTFVQIIGSDEYVEPLYDVLFAKGWGITGDFAKDAEILQSKNIPITGITNVESWLDMIKNCR